MRSAQATVGGEPRPALGDAVGSAPHHLLPASVATREIPHSEEVEPVIQISRPSGAAAGAAHFNRKTPFLRSSLPPLAVFLAGRGRQLAHL